MDHLEIKQRMNELIKAKNIDACTELYSKLPEQEQAKKDLLVFSVLLKIAKIEKENGEHGLLEREDCKDMDDMIDLYYKVKHAIRRMEFGIEQELSLDIFQLGLSKHMLLMMVSLFSYDRSKVAGRLERYYLENGNADIANAFKLLAENKREILEA